MENQFAEKIAFLGAGRIAEVWMERLLKTKSFEPQQIMATDIHEQRLQELAERWGIQTSLNNADGAGFADWLILAVPPPETIPVLKSVAARLRPGPMIVSLAAAVPIEALQQIAGKQPVVRVMPNTPALVGEAMNLVVFGGSVSTAGRSRITALLNVLGRWSEVADADVDFWCALCAVGPTFILPAIDALAAAAAARGLSRDAALQATAQMVAGTARMVQESGRTPELLKALIGLRTLPEDDARKLFTQAYDAAVEKLQAVGMKVKATAV